MVKLQLWVNAKNLPRLGALLQEFDEDNQAEWAEQRVSFAPEQGKETSDLGTAPTPAKPTRQRRATKAPVAPEVVAFEVVAPVVEQPAPSAPVDLPALVAAHAAKHTAAKTFAVIQSFGASRAGNIAADKLDTFVKQLQAEIGA